MKPKKTMKHLIKSVIIVSLLCLAAGCFFACSVSPTVYAPATVNLLLDEEYDLGAVVVPFGADAEIIYFSENPNIAQINQSGKITAKGDGTTTITSSIKGSTATTKVTVVTPATDITVDDTPLFVSIDGIAELRLEELIPSHAVATVDWVVEDTEIADIVKIEGKYMIKGIAFGETTMTGTDIRTQKTASYPIIVIENEVLITLADFALASLYFSTSNYPLGALGYTFEAKTYYILTAPLTENYKEVLSDLGAVKSDTQEYWYLYTDPTKTQSVRADKFGLIFYIANDANGDKWAVIRVFKHYPLDAEISTKYYLPDEVQVFYTTKNSLASTTIGASYKSEAELISIFNTLYPEKDNTDPTKTVYYFTEHGIKYKVEISFEHKKGLTFIKSDIRKGA